MKEPTEASVSGPAVVMRALVDVFADFTETMTWLQAQNRVVKVNQSCWMVRVARSDDGGFNIGRGEGFEIDWYAEADFDFGPTISYAMNVTWDTSEWIMDFSIRGYGKDGEEVLYEVSQTVMDDEVILDAMKQMSTELPAMRQEGLHKFCSFYGAGPTR